MSGLSKFVTGFLPLFYLKTPSNSSFKDVSEVPNYTKEVTLQFFFLIGIEIIVRWLQNKPLPRLNDSISSITAGVILQLSRLVLVIFEVSSYVWVHQNFCIFELPWDSSITWWFAFIGVDFGYYWFHRMAHEVNLFWTAHQVHHSSEDYTLSTALRQSLMQRFTSWFVYLPLALVLPPSVYVVHKQFNTLYQFWIHTEVISNLGPLEWILNTPSHHRVHHGRNPYCIDKNYAGVLIIWDRMFGTFSPESDKVLYGLVHPINSWNPLWVQFHHAIYIISNIGSKEGFKNKLFFLLKGPGWSPGKPRLGNIEDIPQVSPDEKLYDVSIPSWLKAYCLIHFVMVIHFGDLLGTISLSLPYITVLILVLYFIFSLTNFGLMFDRRSGIVVLELLRLGIFFFFDIIATTKNYNHGMNMTFFRLAYGFSFALWGIVGFKDNF